MVVGERALLKRGGHVQTPFDHSKRKPNFQPNHIDRMPPKGGNAKKESGKAKKAENEAKKAEAASAAKVSHPKAHRSFDVSADSTPIDSSCAGEERSF